MTKNKYTGKIPNNLNKGGRPKIGKGLSEKEKEREIYEFKKNKLINFRVTELEKDRIKEKYNIFLEKYNYKKTNYSMTKFILDIIFEKDFNNIYKENNLSKLSFDINKIGININQIVKKVNSYSEITNDNIKKDLEKIQKKLNNIFDLLDNI